MAFMKRAIRESLVKQIDDFYEVEKMLAYGVPEWFENGRRYEMAAHWPILEPDGSSRAHLAFRSSRLSSQEPSISVIFAGYPCYRIDLKRIEVCEANPLTVQHIGGFEALVCGSHCHPWDGNRTQVLHQRNGVWELPVRKNVSQSTRRLPQALAVLADYVRINLDGDQRNFDLPERGGLFS
ncbi:hypothetical protein ACFQ14_04425 [Pseudahrensia aquimaris]|uniref:Uncharacterized protein n=1 Tax=Pseudahrensia aquimaris TaxID=744461 RepID=A0ABW3FD82_9HYPH